MSVYQLIEGCESEYCGVTLGGGAFIDSTWPMNPNGEKMVLLLSIDNDLLNKAINNLNLPCGMRTQVFSTYSDERYFFR
ncbi:hypothetical protein ACMZZG_03535 [Pseudocitrobacter faecalis]|uniref:hypothetical protein n=1 Tax=Pseudocitrobacter faecalis TaxID=1398493 RepID=UPI0039EE4E23